MEQTECASYRDRLVKRLNKNEYNMVYRVTSGASRLLQESFGDDVDIAKWRIVAKVGRDAAKATKNPGLKDYMEKPISVDDKFVADL